MNIDLSRVKAMVLKEYRHILRDKFTVIISFGMPIVMILFFGFIIELNYDNIKILIKDESHTKQSRQFVEKLKAGKYFNPIYSENDNPIKLIDNNAVVAAITIDKDFEKNISDEITANIQIIADGADISKAGLTFSYIQGILEQYSYEMTNRSPAYEIRTRFLFNPQLNSKWFITPGLIVIIIGILSILLPALTIAKEWEKGSMELLLSTHIKPIEIILGKLTPYIALNFLSAFLVFAVSRIAFGIPFNGNILLFCLVCSIFIAACLSLGILISVITKRQQLAVMVSMVIGLMPSLLLSGFIFPVENMPLFFRVLTFILPQRWFMEISRAMFLKGSHLIDLGMPIFMLCILCFLTILLASTKLKTDIEQ
jgi:ABC-2 type transport system permease protein